MKTLLTILFALLLVAAEAQQNTNVIYGTIGNYGLTPQQLVRVTSTLISPNPRMINNVQVRQDPNAVFTDTNGNYYFTNQQWGYYRLDIAGQYGTTFFYNVWTNTAGTVAMGSLITNSAALPPNPSTNYYTQAQIDALIGVNGWQNAWDTNGSATNAAAAVLAVAVTNNQTANTLNAFTFKGEASTTYDKYPYTNAQFTIADYVTGATLSTIANFKIYDAGHGFYSGEGYIWTNNSGSTFSVFSNSVFYAKAQELPLGSTGFSRYSITVTATTNSQFYLRNDNAEGFFVKGVQGAVGTNNYTLGFNSDGNYDDLNLGYDGQTYVKVENQNGFLILNSPNGMAGAIMEPNGVFFGNGSGGTSASVGTNGTFTGNGAGLTNVPNLAQNFTIGSSTGANIVGTWESLSNLMYWNLANNTWSVTGANFSLGNPYEIYANGGGLSNIQSSSVVGLITNIPYAPLYSSAIYVSQSRGSDANSGSLAYPYQTFTNGYLACTNGQTLVVLDGIFTNQSIIYNGANVYSYSGVLFTNPAVVALVTFTNANNETAYFTGQSTLLQCTFTVDGCSNLTFDCEGFNLITGFSQSKILNGSTVTNYNFKAYFKHWQNISSGTATTQYLIGGLPYFYNFYGYFQADQSIINFNPLPQQASGQFANTSYPFTNNIVEFSAPNIIFNTSTSGASLPSFFNNFTRYIFDPSIVYMTQGQSTIESTATNFTLISRGIELPNGAWTNAYCPILGDTPVTP